MPFIGLFECFIDTYSKSVDYSDAKNLYFLCVNKLDKKKDYQTLREDLKNTISNYFWGLKFTEKF